MKKRSHVAIINTLEAAGANVVDDTSAEYWSVMKASADATALFTLLYGKVTDVNYAASQAENRQVVLLDAGATKETVVASTSYAIMIGNPDQDYETRSQHPIVHAYTTPTTLSGVAATDRSNLYTALAAKINAYAGNNATASLLYVCDYTLGGVVAGKTPVAGDTITQETSAVTAVIAKVTLTSGTFAGGDAAGKLWFYSVSDTAAILDTAKTWTFQTNETMLQTNATQVANTGLAIIDDAGYFTSKIGRGGANYVETRRGFASAVIEIAEAAAYAEGIGSVMLAKIPTFDHSKQDMITGEWDFDFEAGDTPDAAKTYRRYVIDYEDGDEDAIGATKEVSKSQIILYVDESNSTNLTNFHNALVAAAAK